MITINQNLNQYIICGKVFLHINIKGRKIMIDFEEEIKKFKVVKGLENIEDEIASVDVSDLNDMIKKLALESYEHKDGNDEV